MPTEVCNPNTCPGAIVESASNYLFAQAAEEFAELRHVMYFGHAAGFSGTSERQSGDVFARATLAHLFLDIAAALPDRALASKFISIARGEAEYVARARLVSRVGGWSYFPDLPELPPDADSLAAAISLFARTAPQHLALCLEAVESVLSGALPDGSFETWIISGRDTPSDRERMQWGVRNCWGSGADPDVMAHFYHALWLWDAKRFRDPIQRGAAGLMNMQQENGTWRATWYAGPAYGTGLALRLLREIETGADAVRRAESFLLDTQGVDGAWGEELSAPLQTALSMAALCDTESAFTPPAIERGASALRSRQLPDGSWPPSPWIKMEIGRATGAILHVATYQSTALTTAFCLRALLWADRHPQLRGAIQ